MAVELASANIRVNGISPGSIATELFHDTIGAAPGYMERRLPCMPLGGPDEVAPVASFLLSDEASCNKSSSTEESPQRTRSDFEAVSCTCARSTDATVLPSRHEAAAGTSISAPASGVRLRSTRPLSPVAMAAWSPRRLTVSCHGRRGTGRTCRAGLSGRDRASA